MPNIITKAISRVPKKVQLDATTCKSLCKEAGLEYLEGYEGRVFEYVVTDETPDRVGDVIKAAGVDLKNYKNNPVILAMHNRESLPIGKSIKTWYDAPTESIKSYALFFDNRVDTTGTSDTIFRFVQAGALKGASIGFKPIEAYSPNNPEERKKLGIGKYGVYFTKSEMLEYSVCPIGCNPSAGVKSIDGVEFSEEDLLVLKSLTKEETSTEFAIIERALDRLESHNAELSEKLTEANLKIVDLINKVEVLTSNTISINSENQTPSISAEDFEKMFKSLINKGKN